MKFSYSITLAISQLISDTGQDNLNIFNLLIFGHLVLIEIKKIANFIIEIPSHLYAGKLDYLTLINLNQRIMAAISI